MKKFFYILIILFVAMGIFIRPPVSGGTVTSWYGLRAEFGREFHTGSDITLPIGTEVRPISWGTVTETGYSERNGNYVIISHLPGTESRYLHLDSISVVKGEKLNPLSVIGTVGNTGLSTGSHLHFEIRLFSLPLPANFLCMPGRAFQAIGLFNIFNAFIGD